MKTGLFFGSFNPVHIGHMILANYMAEFTDLQQVWFVVSPHNPFKQKKTLLDEHHRLEMVKLAIGDNPKLKASDIEFKLPQPSYTIDTLTYLKEKYPKHEFALIVGEDNLLNFQKWKNFEQILDQYQLYVYPRVGSNEHALKDHPKVNFVDAPVIELSSSFIRQAIKNKKDIRYMLPNDSARYIEEMNFYKK
ncbi:MAG: nicotinate (nicotinamide) nucleotide adenylyltransferase [Bacteroidota bacterium]|nr:nicotinate (nicotinamide) nucleotide adenylyltransferase [Bacteroidota bacterium]